MAAILSRPQYVNYKAKVPTSHLSRKANMCVYICVCTCERFLFGVGDFRDFTYSNVSNIRRTKSQNLNVSRRIL